MMLFVKVQLPILFKRYIFDSPNLAYPLHSPWDIHVTTTIRDQYCFSFFLFLSLSKQTIDCIPEDVEVIGVSKRFCDRGYRLTGTATRTHTRTSTRTSTRTRTCTLASTLASTCTRTLAICTDDAELSLLIFSQLTL